MRAIITKVGLPMIGTDQKRYQLVCFRLEKGGSAISYISPDMQNYSRWKDKLKVGSVLDNLSFMKDGKTIDADSHPRLVPMLKQKDLFE